MSKFDIRFLFNYIKLCLSVIYSGEGRENTLGEINYILHIQCIKLFTSWQKFYLFNHERNNLMLQGYLILLLIYQQH